MKKITITRGAVRKPLPEKASGKVDTALAAYRTGQKSLQQAAVHYRLNPQEVTQLFKEARNEHSSLGR